MSKSILKKLYYLIDGSESYRNGEKKKWFRKIYDQIVWMARYREFNHNYYLYGLDRRNSSIDQYLPGWKVDKLRRERTKKEYTCLISDKFIFGQLFRSLGYPLPENKALVESDRIKWLNPRRETPLKALLGNKGKYICKPIDKGGGEGVFLLSTDGDGIFVDEQHWSVDDLRSRLSGRYLMEECVEQHEALRTLHPTSVNTLRLLTVHGPDESELLSSVLRVGRGGGILDSWSQGGIAVSIDPETGKTISPGVIKKEKRIVKTHPETGVSLDGYTIPFFDRCKKIVKAAHEEIPQIWSIGWDVSVSNDGPVILEANERWDETLHMCLEDNFAADMGRKC